MYPVTDKILYLLMCHIRHEQSLFISSDYTHRSKTIEIQIGRRSMPSRPEASISMRSKGDGSERKKWHHSCPSWIGCIIEKWCTIVSKSSGEKMPKVTAKIAVEARFFAIIAQNFQCRRSQPSCVEKHCSTNLARLSELTQPFSEPNCRSDLYIAVHMGGSFI